MLRLFRQMCDAVAVYNSNTSSFRANARPLSVLNGTQKTASESLCVTMRDYSAAVAALAMTLTQCIYIYI